MNLKYRVNQYFHILLPTSPKLHFYFDLKALFSSFQEQCLKMLRMVQQLTSCPRLSCNIVPNKLGCLAPLAAGLFTFISRKLGQHLNPQVVCDQGDIEGFML